MISETLIVILRLIRCMGTIKVDAYTKEQNELAALIRAIAHPARLAILAHLVKTKGCVCGDIVGELNIAQATVSQHLKELKSAGIIKGTVEGRNVCYCIDTDNLANFRELLNNFFNVSLDPNCCK